MVNLVEMKIPENDLTKRLLGLSTTIYEKIAFSEGPDRPDDAVRKWKLEDEIDALEIKLDKITARHIRVFGEEATDEVIDDIRIDFNMPTIHPYIFDDFE